jgi:hypothetical protein
MTERQPPVDLHRRTTAIGDAIWFGFPLRERLSATTLIDFELSSVGNDRPVGVDEIRRTLLEACERELVTQGTRTALVPLSGGLDSRLVLSTLLELLPARDIHCYTYGFKGHLDFEIAPIVARKAGVSHTLRAFHEIAFDVTELEASVRGLDLESAPTLNLVAHYYTKKLSALCLAELPSDAAIWSGFLGDRMWAGKWLDQPSLALRDSVARYTHSYADTLKSELVSGKYDPLERLLALYQPTPSPPANSSWCELIDLQQRQYSVKRSFIDGARRYVFPLAFPDVVQRLLSLPASQRQQYRFYRRYVQRYHAGLFSCPCTTRFGAPLRGSQLREQLDRGLRLTRQRLERLLHVRLGRFEARRYDTALVDSTWPEHRVAVQRGLERMRGRLAELGITSLVDLEARATNRAVSQTLASLGYVL